MEKIHFMGVFFLFGISLIFIFSCSPATEIKAEHGKIDLSSWDFQSRGIVQLDGSWEFYWNKLLYHDDFPLPDQEYAPVYQQVPGLWKNYVIDGKHLPILGYATFRLLVTLPETNTLYAFKLIDMSTAYSLYVDGQYVMGNGKVGTRKEETIPRWQSCTGIYVPQSSNPIEIIIHISNFHYDKPGFWKSVAFGPEDQISASNLRSKTWDYFIIGIYLAIGIYHLVLFFLGRNDKTTLFFGIFCLFFVIRSIFTDERIVFDLFPWINWHAGLLLEFLSVHISVIFFILFLRSLYPKEFTPLINKIIIAVTLVIGSIDAFLPTQMINSVNSFYLLFMLFIIIYICINLIIASVRQRDGALFLLFGFFFFSITVFYDILAAEFIINTNFLSPIGILFFILAEFALYIKFIKAEEELREREKELLQAEKLASLGTLIAGVAHEINNPNSSIFLTTSTLSNIWKNLDSQLAEYMESGGDFYVGGTPFSAVKDEIPGSLDRILRNSQRIKDIVKDLKDYAKKDESILDQIVNINSVINSALRLLENLVKKSTTNFKLHLAENLPPVIGNKQRLEQVIINIIQNACQAIQDPDKGICIETGYNEAEKRIIITITDEGVGMDKKTLKQIYDPFFTTKRSNGGTGLGLAVTSRIIRDHGGTMEVTSKPGKGTRVVIGLKGISNN